MNVVTLRWGQKRTAIMEKALVGKYSSNRYLRRLLFLTTGSTLVECSPMDRIWGIGENSGELKM